MEELFGDPAYKGFVLQDHKRLPARFFARISGALPSRLHDSSRRSRPIAAGPIPNSLLSYGSRP